MLEQLLKELHNWFRVRDDDDGKHNGTYTIEGGSIALPFLQKGQYYRILGSVFNDGLHKYGDESDSLEDETFEGCIWALAIPKAVLQLAKSAEDWAAKYGEAANSPYTSESFGGYSYTKYGSGSGSSDGGAGWNGIPETALAPWRKISEWL